MHHKPVLCIAIAAIWALILVHASSASNATEPTAPANYWLEDSRYHNGLSAWNPGFQVYRNVKDFGAKGDGVTDDTAAINAAISSGGRCGQGCDSSTLAPAIVYFPSGTYIVSNQLVMYYFTQMVGNPNNRPIIQVASSFNEGWVINSDPYGNGGNNWYTNQNNFYRQIRSIIFDLRSIPHTTNAAAIHWQVAQATSITDVKILLSRQPGTQHQGIWMENGSGGFMSSLEIDGGKFGMWVGNQQFTSRNVTITNADTAIFLNWDWGWTFKGITISGCRIGFDHSVPAGKPLTAGSAIIVDAVVSSTQTFVRTSTSSSSSPRAGGGLLLNNIILNGVAVAVASASGDTLLSGGSYTIPVWGEGQLYNSLSQSASGSFTQGKLPDISRSPAVLDKRSGRTTFIFEKPRPDYRDYTVNNVINVKSMGAKGDGHSDDTSAINQALASAANKNVLYFPPGAYIVTDTIRVPPGSRITGSLWAIIMASGSRFANINAPYPVVQVGQRGDSGVAELSDMMFSTNGPLPGAIMVEWNIRDPAGQQGAAGMWDCHFRIGGAEGTNMGSGQCPRGNQPTAACMGPSMLLHLTSGSSAYLENMWAWTADHDLDGPHSQLSIFTGRGILIESSQGPVWMYGTAAEHNVMYQYSVVNAQNVVMGMIQTETPYYQPSPRAPAPHVYTPALNDPNFSNCATASCAMAWGLRIVNSTAVYVYGTGLYSFFSNYDQTCLNSENCQDSMIDIVTSPRKGLNLYNINTKAATNMVVVNGAPVVEQSNNPSTFCQGILTNLALA